MFSVAESEKLTLLASSYNVLVTSCVNVCTNCSCSF